MPARFVTKKAGGARIRRAPRPGPIRTNGAMRAALAGIAVVLLSAATLPFLAACQAEPQTGGPSEVAPMEGDLFPYQFEIEDFDNGLRLITIPTDYPDIVSLHIVVGTGSRNEIEEGKSGFAHFFEHMMFRGTRRTSTE